MQTKKQNKRNYGETPGKPRQTVISIKVNADERKKFGRAAKKSGKTLSSWLRSLGLHAL